MSNKPCFNLLGLASWALATALLSSPLFAATHYCSRAEVTDRPRIGLVLGGGGARGYAHIGVLGKLEELRIPFDYIAGTSMGSIVGGLLATGMDTGELKHVVEQADWNDLFKDKTSRENLPFRRKADDDLGLFGPKLGIGKNSSLLPKGVVSGQKISFMFESITSQRVNTSDFDQLPIPYRAIATDIVSGDMVVLDEGELSMAMRASMSVPAVFDPVRHGEALLVDGGLVRNLPIDVARDMGAEVVIAVDVGTKLASKAELKNALAILYQMSGLLTVQNTEEQIRSLGDDDVLIAPNIGDTIASADFGKLEEAIPLGYTATELMQDKLKKYSVSEAEYLAWREQISDCIHGPPQMHFVQLDNQSRFSDKIILELITISPGESLDVDQLDHDLRQVYGLGFIREARYNIVEKNGKQGINITVHQDERGTQFIETGLDLDFSDRGASFNIRAGYLHTALDDHGAEFRSVVQIGESPGIFASYYKPLDDGLKYSIHPSVSLFSRPLLIYDSKGHALGEIELDEWGGAVVFGREFSRNALALAGVNRYAGNMDITVGNPELEPFKFDGAELTLELTYDRLDDRYLPTRGLFSRLRYIHSTERLGADDQYEQFEFDIFGNHTKGLHNFSFSTRYHITLDDNAPIYALYTAGGFLNMSGFEPNSLIGQHYGQITTGYRYQVKQSGFLPGYVGMTLEYGNAVPKRSEIFSEGILNGSFYLAYKSPLGPIYMGIGWSEERNANYFLRIGSIIGPGNLGRR